MRTKLYLFILLTALLISGAFAWQTDAVFATSDDVVTTPIPALDPIVLPEYNARDEFALTQGGTNGFWNYGYSTSDLDNTLNLFTVGPDTDTVAGCSGGVFERWRINNSDTIPQIARHNPALTCSNVPSNAVFMHPGFNNQRAVLRFNAPVSGTFQVTGTFQKQNPSATSDLKIIKNATLPGETVLYTGTIGAVYQQSFNFTVMIAAGDKIDFSVGDGDNGQNSDGSSIAVTIGEPVTACLTAPANSQVNVPAENSPSDVQSINTNAQLVGDATYTNMGKVGRAFEFDGGGDYVRIEDNPAQLPATAVTVEGWFKFDSASGIISLISKPIRNSPFNSYTLYLDGGSLRGLVGNASQFTRVASNFTPQAGVWQHLAFTYNFSGGVSTLKLYANGVEVTSGQDGTANLPLFYDANPYPLLIGADFENNSPTFFLDGQADEVSIYGRALSQSEIFNLVKQGSFGKCPPAQCVQSPNNLVSWFAGEQNALDSRSNNHGTNNGATFNVGRVGQAFNFNGSSSVGVPDSSSLDMTSAVTVESWVKPSSGGNPSFHSIADKGDFGVGRRNFGVYVYQNDRIYVSYIDTSGFNVDLFTASVLTVNSFNHVAAVFNPSGNTLAVYVNGALVGSRAVGNPLVANNDPFVIGSGFSGQIDEVSIYSRGLSQSEIQSIVDAGQSGKCKPSPVNSPTNQIAWLTGDGDTRDFVGLNPNGILRGDANFKVGRVGQSFNFDGTGDYVEIADDADHRPANITVEGWFKANSLAGAPHFVSKPLVGNNSNSYVIWYQNGELRGGHGNSSGGFDTLLTGFSPYLGEWYHFAYSIDDAADTHRFFVNGTQIASGATTLPIFYDTVNPHPLLIGGELDSNVLGSFLNGQADEVSLYNRALTPSEIAAIYNAGVAGKIKVKPTGAGSNVNTQLSDATVTFANVSVAGSTSQNGIDLGSLPRLPSNVTFTGLAYNISTTATHQNGAADDLRVCFNLPSLASIGAGGLRVLHLEGTSWIDRTAVGNTLTNFCTDNLTSLSPFAIVEGSATVNYAISGRVTTGGNGLGNVLLTLAGGASATATTNSNGDYSFGGLPTSGTYTITPTLNGYTFAPVNRIYPSISTNITDAHFAATSTPTVSISSVTSTEGNTGTKPFNFTIQLASPSSQPTTVNVATSDGTATVADNDYQPSILNNINLATSGTASQSSTDYGGLASRANDGNTDGNFNNHSVSHTASQSQPYWDLDLGAGNASKTLDRINVWNRTDGDSNRTVNFHVFVSDNPFTGMTVAASQAQIGVQDNFNAAQAGSPTTIDIANRTGRYIRVQLEGSTFLHLAEVQVFAVAAGPQPVTFAPGETTKTVTVNVVGDTRVEPDETFTVIVTDNSPTPQTLTTGTGTITNDDVASGCVPVPLNQVAWFKAENNANDSQGANNGALQGGATFAAGRVGQAFNFPAFGDFVSVPDSASLRPTNFTVEGWFNFSTPPSGTQFLASKNAVGRNSFIIYYENGILRGQTSDASNFGISASTPFTPTVGQWYHIAYTWQSGGNEVLYVNGAAVDTNSADVAPAYTNNPFTIGASATGGLPFRGSADEVSIYSRALLATEIQSINNAASAGKCPSGCNPVSDGLLNSYRGENNLNDSQGTNNGTAQGNPAYVAGRIGSGLSFDGASSVVINRSVADDFSIEFWMKSAQTGGSDSQWYNGFGLVDAEVSGNTRDFGVSLGAGKLLFGTGDSDQTISSPAAVNDNLWHHVVVTRVKSSGAKKLYVDGAEVAAGTGSTSSLNVPTNIRLGGLLPGFSFYNGLLDEVKIYNRALSPSEVQRTFSNNCTGGGQCTPAPTNQIVWYRGDNSPLDWGVNPPNHAAMENGATFALGKVGYAFSLDGVDDLVAAPDNDKLDITGDLTIEAWVRPAQVQAGEVTIVSKRDTANSNVNYMLFLRDGELRFASRSGG